MRPIKSSFSAEPAFPQSPASRISAAPAGYPPETILSHTFYKSNPEEFFRFYRAKMLCPEAKPNAAHKKLAQWEQEGRLLAVVTQNIDGLHQAAGSRNVYELHGSVHRNHCERCGKFTASTTFCIPPAFPGAPAAASSSRMWCSMRKR